MYYGAKEGKISLQEIKLQTTGYALVVLLKFDWP